MKMSFNLSFCWFSLYFTFLVTFCTCKELQKDLVSQTRFEHDVKIGWGWNSHNNNGSLMPEILPRCLNATTLPIIDPTTSPFLTKYRIWYYNGGSQSFLTNLAKLLGHSVTTQEELNQMCPTLVFSFQGDDPPPVFYSGYGVQVLVSCDNNGNCHMSNIPGGYDGHLGADPFSNYVTLNYYLIATDYKTYQIFYVCTDKFYGDYQLVTTSPYVSPEIAAAFLEFKYKYGFKNSTPQLLSCQSPKFDKPYPPPFQNYPHSVANPITFGWPQHSHSSNGWSQNSHYSTSH